MDGIVNYGYHDEVILPAELRAPAAGWPAKPFGLTAHVKWVVCRDICLPGRAEVSIQLPTGRGAPAGSVEGLARAIARVPGPPPPTWRLTGSEDKDVFTVSIETGRPESTADFFPKAAGQVDASSEVKASPHPRGVTLTLRKSDFLGATVPSLEGVVVLSGGRAYEVTVPMANHRNHP